MKKRKIKYLRASRGFLVIIFLVTRWRFFEINLKHSLFPSLESIQEILKKIINFCCCLPKWKIHNPVNKQNLFVSLLFLLLEVQSLLGWSRLSISTLRYSAFLSFAKVSLLSRQNCETQKQGGQPVLVGLDQLRERTEEGLEEVLEEKLPNLPVAFIKVHLFFHNWTNRSDLRSTRSWWRQKRRGEKEKKIDWRL